MPSNVREYESSCPALADGMKRFYQCRTCDKTKQVYLCSDCYVNGRHQNHNCNAVTNYTEIVFCNCGDITGKLSCSDHEPFIFRNQKKLPLHFNQDFFDAFIRNFNLTDQVGRRLSRLNQIRKVYYRSKDGKMIKKYFSQSNARGTQMSLRNCYSVFRKDHEKRFVDNNYDNERRLLLWHGTKLRNLESILQNGFRRPASGGMFGNGVYFADRVSKSANYTDASGVEILFLCEVSLGSMYRTGLSKSYTRAPNSFISIKGVGKSVPDKSDNYYFGDVIVPLGKTIPNPHQSIVFSQIHFNEYITFEPDRILIKFIVHFDRNANNSTN